jgi:hypothetical protein
MEKSPKNEEAVEKIDQARVSKDVFSELIKSIISYYTNEELDLKERLSIERQLKKYQDQNTSDWLLNLVLESLKEHEQSKDYKEWKQSQNS